MTRAASKWLPRRGARAGRCVNVQSPHMDKSHYMNHGTISMFNSSKRKRLLGRRTTQGAATKALNGGVSHTHTLTCVCVCVSKSGDLEWVNSCWPPFQPALKRIPQKTHIKEPAESVNFRHFVEPPKGMHTLRGANKWLKLGIIQVIEASSTWW